MGWGGVWSEVLSVMCGLDCNVVEGSGGGWGVSQVVAVFSSELTCLTFLMLCTAKLSALYMDTA